MNDKVDKSTRTGLILGVREGKNQGLTKTEEEILHLLTDEFLTQRQIAVLRGCTPQAVSKIIQKLKKKGAYNIGLEKVDKTGWSYQPSRLFHGIRLHGQEFNIQIIFKDGRYERIVQRCNILLIDGNRVVLYKDSIEIYSKKMFLGEDAQQATSGSFEYWDRFFVRLEHELRVILIKPRSQNIKLVKAEYAEINNELAREYNLSADKIRVYTKDDGKLWFLIDNSLNLHEAETVHPETAKQDIEKVKDVFNDIRDKPHLKLSELSQCMAETAKQLNELTHGVNALVTYLRAQITPDSEDTEIVQKKPEYFG